MKILHIVLACFYVEGLGYQENLLPKYHKLFGNDVTILTSDFPNSRLGDPKYAGLKEYDNDDGVRVIKLERNELRVFGKELQLNRYDGVYEAIDRVKPDVIFIHGLTSAADIPIARYLRRHREVRAFADQHADYFNSPVDTAKKRAFMRMIWQPIIGKLKKPVIKFWGTTPWRCEYMEKVYDVPPEKIDLLVMGADNRKIDFAHQAAIRARIRSELDLAEDDFVVVSGGKIDRKKNIHLLMQAVRKLNAEKLKLIVFGNVAEEIRDEIEALTDDRHIRNVGWLGASEVYNYFLAADLAFFPGTHSVLWEQACGCGIPCVFKEWEGMRHVSNGGNAILMKEVTVDSAASVLQSLYTDPERVRKMKRRAMAFKDEFSYEEVAKRAIAL
ncbi:MAG: glycosyltransferase family 4 protein [Oscillospiraceae bacterium]|nr:glycosyltransferase family 4 protein [Oscillospiraceae bacterium]